LRIATFRHAAARRVGRLTDDCGALVRIDIDSIGASTNPVATG
jgi:hypothetical protein